MAEPVITLVSEECAIGSTTWPQILAAARDLAVMPESDILGIRRTKNISRVRQTCFYFARRYTSLSVADIGRACGGRDHTTVLYGIAKVRERLAARDEWQGAFVRQMREKLKLNAPGSAYGLTIIDGGDVPALRVSYTRPDGQRFGLELPMQLLPGQRETSDGWECSGGCEDGTIRNGLGTPMRCPVCKPEGWGVPGAR